MILGSPGQNETPSDPSVAESPSDETGGNTDESDSSALSRLLDGARTLSDILAPFTAFASSIVHLITAYKFFNHS